MESNCDYLSNESEKSKFHSGNQKICPDENSEYSLQNQALKNGNFANDLGFRRNHFCWVRDVKLLLDSKFHNFSNQYVSVANENAFDQFQLIFIDWKLAIFQTVSEFDETSFVRTVSSIRNQKIFFWNFSNQYVTPVN